MESLNELLVHDLKDLHDAEQQIIKALPKMAEATSAPQLKQAFEEHLHATKRQLERLDRILVEMGENPGSKKCKGMKGLIEEGKDLMKEDAEASVLDAGLVSAAQKVEHYEMAAYSSAHAYAELLGHAEAAKLLQQTLQEEAQTEKKLATIAASMINGRAANGK